MANRKVTVGGKYLAEKSQLIIEQWIGEDKVGGKEENPNDE